MTLDLLSLLLARVYPPGGARRPWKDQLADWLLDRSAQQGSLDARDLLEGLRLVRPAFLEALRHQPDLREDLAAALTPETTATTGHA